MPKDFRQIEWDAELEDDCRQLVRLAVREDLSHGQDWTTVALVPRDRQAQAQVIVRQAGILAGMRATACALHEMDSQVNWQPELEDGGRIEPGDVVALMQGPARNLLTCERIVLNFLARLSGIASRTSHFVDAVASTEARIYDTRKTTPGWRKLEKYAVRCGGGHNHRTGLYDAVLIKDNHLALGRALDCSEGPFDPAQAVGRVRRCLNQLGPNSTRDTPNVRDCLVEVEIDALATLEDVLAVGPDLVLLDNFSPPSLRSAVQLRDRVAPHIELEASGGIDLQSVRDVAASGVERISVGAITHSAPALDVSLDVMTNDEIPDEEMTNDETPNDEGMTKHE